MKWLESFELRSAGGNSKLLESQMQKLIVKVDTTEASCPMGEITGKKNIRESKIPVLSCEGTCIRGDIARLAANIVSKEQAYG
jgi:hypothetical protein